MNRIDSRLKIGVSQEQQTRLCGAALLVIAWVKSAGEERGGVETGKTGVGDWA